MSFDTRTASLFRRVLVSYLSLVFVGVVVSAVVHRTAYEIAAEQIRNGRVAALALSANTVDLYFEELDTVARRISSNPRFELLLGASRDSRSVRPIRAYDVWNEIRFDLINSHVIDDAYLYVPHLEVVISRDRIILDPKRHYAALYGSPDIEYERWKGLVSVPVSRVLQIRRWVADGLDLSGVGYLRSYPLDHESVSVASMLFIVADSTIRDAFAPMNDESLFTAILAQDGTLIAGFGEENAVTSIYDLHARFVEESGTFDHSFAGSGTAIVTYRRSARQDLIYLAGLKVSRVYARIRWVRLVALAAILFYAAAGCIGAVLFARTNMQPFTELVARNVLLSSIIDESKPHLRASFLNRLLHGGFDTDEDIVPFVAEYELPRSQIGYRVILMRSRLHLRRDTRTEVTAARQKRGMFLDRLKHVISTTDLVFSFGDESVYVLHAMTKPEVEDDSVVAETGLTLKRVARSAGLDVFMGIGNAVVSLVELKRSLDQALEAAEYGEYTGASRPLLYRSLPSSQSDAYYFPADLSLRLEHSVRAGDIRPVDETLAELYRRNFTQLPLSAGMTRQLLYDLRGTFIRAVGGRARSAAVPELAGSVASLFDTAYDAKPPEFETLVEAFRTAARAIGSAKRSHHDGLRERIVEFVDENITNPNLSIALVATEHDLSEDYVSRFFHEQVGETFSHHVESSRLVLAQRMLETTTQTVEAIAAECGFGSVRTLRRSLQRRLGVSPSQIRSVPSPNGS